MTGYSVEIKECSKELSARERIILKDLSNAIKLDSVVTSTEKIVITPTAYAILAIHNEKSENTDYEAYIIISDSGEKYVTCSPSFWRQFISIWNEMSGEDESYEIECYKLDSKNYKGKQFLTCSII